MSKRGSDSEFRNAIISGLKDALREHKLSRSKAAELLGIKRQTLWLYLKGRATPGGEVLRRAFDLWGLRIELGNYVITKESFGPEPGAIAGAHEQLNLLDQLDKLNLDQLEVAAIGRQGDYFEFKIRIKATVTQKKV